MIVQLIKREKGEGKKAVSKLVSYSKHTVDLLNYCLCLHSMFMYSLMVCRNLTWVRYAFNTVHSLWILMRSTFCIFWVYKELVVGYCKVIGWFKHYSIIFDVQYCKLLSYILYWLSICKISHILSIFAVCSVPRPL